MSFKEKYGPWALVTGASSGIGVEFAKQLAAKKLNLVLVARRKEQMDEVAQELINQYGIEVKVISLDLAQEGFYKELAPQIKDIDLGLIVNNAGINCEGHFYRGDLDRNLQMLRLNVEAPFILAYNLAQPLLEKGRGGIIFTSSSSAFQATPFLSHYGATKSYILSLAESMHYEFSPQGVDVLALCPGMTQSEMTKGMKSSPLVMKVEPVFKASLLKLVKSAYVLRGIGNKLQAFMTQRVLGRDLSRNIAGAMMKRILPGVRPKKKG